MHRGRGGFVGFALPFDVVENLEPTSLHKRAAKRGIRITPSERKKPTEEYTYKLHAQHVGVMVRVLLRGDVGGKDFGRLETLRGEHSVEASCESHHGHHHSLHETNRKQRAHGEVICYIGSDSGTTEQTGDTGLSGGSEATAPAAGLGMSGPGGNFSILEQRNISSRSRWKKASTAGATLGLDEGNTGKQSPPPRES